MLIQTGSHVWLYNQDRAGHGSRQSSSGLTRRYVYGQKMSSALSAYGHADVKQGMHFTSAIISNSASADAAGIVEDPLRLHAVQAVA